MRTREEVSPEKLRGGFYTPDALVDVCLGRAGALLPADPGLRVLEPSAGDGAFLRGLRRAAWRERIGGVVAVEPVETEAAKCRRALGTLHGEVRVGSAIGVGGRFDVAVGNPPFVRFQFVSAADRLAADALGARMGLRLTRVGNLWIPVLLAALGALRPGGAFAFVVPAELLTGRSAAVVRTWLEASVSSLGIDHFPPGSFPGVLQEVVILSGRAGATDRPALPGGRATWTHLLLSPDERAAADSIDLPHLGELARFEVSTVTGANGFFCVTADEARALGLADYARPLLSRLRYAPGLVCERGDAVMLDLPPGVAGHPYLAEGEQRGLHNRHKCSVRKPWWQVPVVEPGDLLLSKRSHRMPRLVVNAAGVVTTDTIYRGRTAEGVDARDLAATFHSTPTLLSAELEGRSFGGGVLELVPSEVARLQVGFRRGAGAGLERLDALARGGAEAELVAVTDAALGLPADGLALLRSARARLAGRRAARAGLGARQRRQPLEPAA